MSPDEKGNQTLNSSLLVTIGFGASLVLFVVLLGYGLNQLKQTHANVHRIVNEHNTKEHLVQEMHQAARERVLHLFIMASTEDPFDRDDQFLEFTANGGRFARARLALQDMPLTPEEKAILDTQGRNTAKAVPMQDEIVELIKNERLAEAISLLTGEALDAQNAVLTNLDQLVGLQRNYAEITLQHTDDQQTRVQVLMTWLGAIATAIAILIAFIIIRRVRLAENRLNDMNERLEVRVEERTQALADANEELHGAIHRLKETQQQLIHSEKMASLGGLVAGISHEVNTPVGIAVTAGSNIDERIAGLQRDLSEGKLTKSAMNDFMEHISESSRIMLANLQRASDLISSFKQVAVDQSSEKCRQVALHEYCDEIITSLHPQLKRRPIQVANDCDPDTMIYTHPGALYQVISNLVVNSLTHAYPAEDTPGHIQIRSSRSGEYVVIDYTDDGQGIPEDHLDKIFDPFFTTRRGQGGSGLGLNIVYNLVNSKLRGEITVENRETGGAHFRIRFPGLSQEECDEHVA